MSNLRGNFFGGITAAVVALPLALAFGVSSGAGAAAGLYGAIFVGLFAALFGGTKTQISGPTGPITVVMALAITDFIGQSPEHGLALAFSAVILGGLFQIIFGLLRIGKYIILVPYPVISGFMSGIGIIIIILQMGPFLGHPAGASIISVLQSLPDMLAAPNVVSILLSTLTLAIIYLWPAKLRVFIPSPLAALIIGTISFIIFSPNSELSTIGAIELGLPALQMPYIEFSMLGDVIKYALMFAGLGAVDSLLTSLVADNMTRTKHNSNKELIGQGIGNMVAGLFAAIPGAGATMRTVINIKTGGTSNLSGVIHAVVLLAIALGAGGLVENIPYAVLAGILIKVGIDIIDWQFIKRLHRLPAMPQFLMSGVLLLTVFYDLMSAVILGMFITNIVTIDRLTNLQLDGLFLSDGHRNNSKLNDEEKARLQAAKGKILLFHLDGPMSFGVASAIKYRFDGFTEYQHLILDFSKASIVGITTSLVIEELIKTEQASQKTVYLTGINESLRQTFSKLDILSIVPEQHQMHSRMDAIQSIERSAGKDEAFSALAV